MGPPGTSRIVMPARQVLARATRAERAQDRRHIGSLAQALILPRTLRRYSTACNMLFDHLEAVGGAGNQTWDSLGVNTAEFVEKLWHEGEGKQLAVDALAGLQHFIPRSRYALPSAWRLIKAWGRLELPARASPITVEMLFGLVGFMVRSGHPR
eukprot:6462358-Lingulodinium_polyedra.AAC.1